MRSTRFLGVTALVVTIGVGMSCRLGESLDDFTKGGPGATGGSSGTGGTNNGGSGGSGGTAGGSGGTAGGVGGGGTGGTGGTSPDFVACDGTPVSCEDIGSTPAERTKGCCDGNTRYWCEDLDASWELRSENCDTTASTCDYEPTAQAMRCVAGTGGTGGSSACESGDCNGQCKDCDGDQANECETDTNTDSTHCGECGHSCQGGTCTNGNCQVVVLAPNQRTPWGITVDDTSVFWLSEGASVTEGVVRTVPIGGGTSNDLADGQNGPVQLTQDTEYLYWTNFGGGGALRRMRKNGTDLSSLAQASGPWALAIDSQYVYWTNTSDGSIRRVVKQGGQPVILITGEAAPRGIAVDSTHVYWTTSAGGEVRRATVAGSNPETLVTGQDYPLSIAVDDEWVYWTEVGSTYSAATCTDADGRIMAARKNDGSALTTIADNQACPLSLTVRDNVVFWTNLGTTTGTVYNYDGTVQQVNWDGTGLKLVASGQDNPYGISVTATAVYWTNQGVFAGQGSVMKIAR